MASAWRTDLGLCPNSGSQGQRCEYFYPLTPMGRQDLENTALKYHRGFGGEPEPLSCATTAHTLALNSRSPAQGLPGSSASPTVPD